MFGRYFCFRSFCSILALLAVSCSSAPKHAAETVSPDRLSTPTPRDPYADDLGRFLAGLHGRTGSQFADLEAQPAWVRHRKELDRAWNRIEETSLPAMRAFQKTELCEAPISKAPVFYPFSGPDALMVTVFFPANPTYVMVGLEPAGTLPHPKQLARKEFEKYLTSIRATLDSELSRSFFITRQMDRQFRGQVTDGLFLPILVLLVRSGHTILGYRYVRLNDSGEVTERSADLPRWNKTVNTGVEMDFRRDDDSSVHKLLYITANLSDAGLARNPGFLKLLGGLGGSSTLLKATSYMVHKPEFSTIRQTVLSMSAAVLQDDSGVPYRYFSTPKWRVQLYGSYVRPYGSFRWLQQADLREAYLSSNPKALDFRIGYGYGKVESNLLLARKEN